MNKEDYTLLIWKNLEYKDIYFEDLEFEEVQKIEKVIELAFSLNDVSGMFSAEKLEQAYEDGIESEEQRCGVF